MQQEPAADHHPWRSRSSASPSLLYLPRFRGFLTRMFSLLARDRTASAVRFNRFPIPRASTPFSANDRRISSSAGVHGLVANRPVSVISPLPSAGRRGPRGIRMRQPSGPSCQVLRARRRPPSIFVSGLLRVVPVLEGANAVRLGSTMSGSGSSRHSDHGPITSPYRYSVPAERGGPSLRPSRTASLTFARSRRSSGGSAITAS
jgi:hypothetical protein